MNGKTERDRWHATKALWRFGAAAVLGSALLAALVNGSTPASANTVYDWQGICTLGCTGTASGVLTLTNGASPYSFSASDFVSFQFSRPGRSFWTTPLLTWRHKVASLTQKDRLFFWKRTPLDRTRCRFGNWFPIKPLSYHSPCRPNQEVGSF